MRSVKVFRLARHGNALTGSSETPSNRHKDPKCKVILGEHLGRDGTKWPDDGQDDRETPTSDGDPLLHLLEVCLVLLFGLEIEKHD